MHSIIRRALIFWLLIAIIFNKPILDGIQHDFKKYASNVKIDPVNNLVDNMLETDQKPQ
jgi:hypothetical protein